ncbi:MAG: preprotein translocase subunit SecA [bacterium]|nr:preprotein translocase subunit SecA [bacterium]
MQTIIKLMMGDPVKRLIKQYQPIVDKINDLEPEIKKLSEEELKAMTPKFKDRLSNGETPDDILPEVFAVVRETASRALGMRHFDVQLIGGIVLHEGKIAEMKTGEGKTLVATLAAYLNALEGKGVYVVTVNDYLARRDSEWMGAVYKYLGLTVGVIQNDMSPEKRRVAYDCDITYGTNNEFGFDYLRDNLASDLESCCQNRKYYAIIDEVDSILIDEARTPLIISGPVRDSTSKYVKIAKMTGLLKKEDHFTVDEKHKNVVLTETGISKIEQNLGVNNVYSVKNMQIAHIATQCLKARYLFKRDVDYVVKNGEVMIVDEFTGRILEGRRYSDGLHQAIEAIEGLTIRDESQTLASVTFQNYFRMFPKLAGMTGTAATEAAEFESIYSLEVAAIPTNMPMVRKDHSDVIYKSKEEKYKAIVAEIKELYKKGQPVLVGTIAIETSELLSEYLKRSGIPHNVLNAKHHEREAEIIAKAGQKKSVTIATNMAGRGTDIVLGEGVKEAGGLFVIGSERHEARRIDNQLRGRSGRQGDPGASRFYVSLEDDLMKLFGSDRIAKIMETLGMPDDTPIEHSIISRSIEKAQGKVEKYYFSIRKQVLEYDDVMNKQRTTIYGMRRLILEKKNLDGKVQEFTGKVVDAGVMEFFENNSIDEKATAAFECFTQKMRKIFPLNNIKEVIDSEQDKESKVKALKKAFYKFYLFRKAEYADGVFDEYVSKRVLLNMLDRQWMDQLHNMDVLREGIGLRAWGQRDPLVEYKMEGFGMFQVMLLTLAEESLEMINRSVLLEKEEYEPEDLSASTPMYYNQSKANNFSSKKQTNKVGRNGLCPCGSGRKYKKCCMN